jgi:hypothetical protein
MTRGQLGEGEDPDGVYLRALVDVDDRDEIVAEFIDRLVEMQVEEGLPIYVLLNRPAERNSALLRAGSPPLASATMW